MSRIADKLSTLNALRSIAGKAPLASWKNSEAELDQRIADLTPAQNLVKIPQEPDRTEVLKAMEKAVNESTVPVTVLPPAPELKATAKRKAIIEKIAADSVAKDTPTTVIDAKATSRKLRQADKEPVVQKAAPKQEKDKKAKADITESTKRTKATAKKLHLTAKSDNAFGALLTELGLVTEADKKKARQKLRKNRMGAPYTDLKTIRTILTTDGRKKK